MVHSFISRLLNRPYIYSALDESASEIRLLTLLPGNFADEIYIVLKSIPFPADVSPVPAFEALSYVWGTDENHGEIKVVAPGWWAPKSLVVRQNLYSLLPYLRYSDRSRTLWIDAICINQQDLRERSEQVEHMTDIFSLASRVIVWLGPEKDGSTEALKFLQSIGSKASSVNAGIEPTPGESAEWTESSKRLLRLNSREQMLVEHLLFRPWFERLWVQQEILLAKAAIAMSGTAIIPFQHLRTALDSLQRKAEAGAIGLVLRSRVVSIMNLFNSGLTGSLLDTMGNARHCKCSDPKDRVYALLGMSKFGKEGLIKPDYSKSKSDVYREVVTTWLAQYKSLRPLLSCSLLDNESDNEVEFGRHPSWVPDWSEQETRNPLLYLLPGCWTNLYAYVEILPGNVLCSVGIELFPVKTATYIGLPESGLDIFPTLRRLVPIKTTLRDYVNGGTVFDAYCRILAGGTKFREDWNPPALIYPSEQKSKIALLKCLQHPELDAGEPPWWEEDEEFMFFFSAVSHWSHGRSIVLAEDGRLGLAPKAAKAGDMVCVLFGCQYPILLRPTQDNSNPFRVVGECFVDGFSNGEAILGRMPDHYKMLHQTGAEHFNQPLFRNSRTGREQIDDPRFKHVLGDEYKEWHGLDFETWFDWRQRTMCQVFQKRGVTHTTFALV